MVMENINDANAPNYHNGIFDRCVRCCVCHGGRCGVGFSAGTKWPLTQARVTGRPKDGAFLAVGSHGVFHVQLCSRRCILTALIHVGTITSLIDSLCRVRTAVTVRYRRRRLERKATHLSVESFVRASQGVWRHESGVRAKSAKRMSSPSRPRPDQSTQPTALSWQ